MAVSAPTGPPCGLRLIVVCFIHQHGFDCKKEKPSNKKTNMLRTCICSVRFIIMIAYNVGTALQLAFHSTMSMFGGRQSKVSR